MKRINIGDVFKINTPKGNAYFQYVFDNKTIGELIRILPGLFEIEPPDLSELVENEEIYFLHFPLKAAFKQAIISWVGNFTLPNEMTLPKHMRAKKVDKDGNFIGWQIVDYSSWERQTKVELSEEQKKLSPWGIWNDTLLIQRLTEGWKPENWL